ncbi:hypothetical protein BDF14DRAFT_1835918 [Spinellus fusiger]|nr:hypothetical protein BDF14DRAFT_1835918 [Spinellus fusiger]
MATLHPTADLGQAFLSDGTVVRVNDHVFLASEHLGEPYHVGRIMEFPAAVAGKGQQVRIAWFNRPKDVLNRKHHDPRLLFATMQSDLNPLSAIRGKCTVTHKHYIGKEGLELYRSLDDHFYFYRLYDRYMQRMYEVVTCDAIQNVPPAIQKALQERYQFVVVEQSIVEDLAVDRCNCSVCDEWCPSAKSVKCAACHKGYHMACLSPPLLRKPSKGFAWQCASCTKELLSSSQNTSPPSESDSGSGNIRPMISTSRPKRQTRTATRTNNTTNNNTTTTTTTTTTTDTLYKPDIKPVQQLKKRTPTLKDKPKAPQEIAMTNMWPFRYFTMSTQLLDIESNTNCYPHAKSRIGAKYQADTPEAPTEDSQGNNSQMNSQMIPQSIALLLTADEGSQDTSRTGKRKYTRRVGRPLKRRSATSPGPGPGSGSGSVSGSVSGSGPFHEIEQEMDEKYTPILRGTDSSVTPIFSQTQWSEEKQDMLEQYMDTVKSLPNLPLSSHSGDLLDRALLEFEQSNYNPSVALSVVSQLVAEDFAHVVQWSDKEVSDFEQGVRDYGHDFNLIKQKIHTKQMADIVRFFYQWKKTDRYEPVYSEWTKVYRPTKRIKRRATMAQDSFSGQSSIVSMDSDSDSEETDLTVVPTSTYTHNAYRCLNCHTTCSPLWRRPPSDTDRRRKEFSAVLCDACGVYWLKYGKNKPVSSEYLAANHRGRGRPLKIQPEKLAETTIFPSANTLNSSPIFSVTNSNRNLKLNKGSQKLFTKLHKVHNKYTEQMPIRKRLKLIKERINASRQVKEATSCSLCCQMEPIAQLLVCIDCGMSAHHDCVGAPSDASHPWTCDVCTNRRHPRFNNDYTCSICMVEDTVGRPKKPTSDYKWAHISCAIFIPEVKFVRTQFLQEVEYINAIHPARANKECTLCHCAAGAKVSCNDCQRLVHVECAAKNNFQLVFELVEPLKSSIFLLPPLSPHSTTENDTKITLKTEDATEDATKDTKEDTTNTSAIVGATHVPTIPLLPAGIFDTEAPSGMMIPQVWCPDHSLDQRHTIPLHARTLDNEASCIKTYSHLYKFIEADSTPALRKIYGINYKFSCIGHLSPAFHHPRIIKSSIPSENASHSIPTPHQSAIAAMVNKYTASSPLF